MPHGFSFKTPKEAVPIMINAKVCWGTKVVLMYCLHLNAVHHLLSHDTLLGEASSALSTMVNRVTPATRIYSEGPRGMAAAHVLKSQLLEMLEARAKVGQRCLDRG